MEFQSSVSPLVLLRKTRRGDIENQWRKLSPQAIFLYTTLLVFLYSAGPIPQIDLKCFVK